MAEIRPLNNTASILASLPDIVLVLDEMARINFATAGTGLILGTRPRDWVGMSALDSLHPDDVCAFVERLNLARSGESTPTTALRVRVSVGNQKWTTLAAHGFTPIDSQGLVGILVLFRDLTGEQTRRSTRRMALEGVFQRKSAQRELECIDREWVATELLPRLLDRLEGTGSMAAVIVMSLSYHGESPADATLDAPVGQLAHRVRQMLRPEDTLSRLGDSQLVVVCCDLTNPVDAHEIAGRLHTWCSAGPPAQGNVPPLTLSTGYALASAGDSAGDVLDFAMSGPGQIDSGDCSAAA